MYYELNVITKNKSCKAFLHEDAYSLCSSFATIHKHTYSEIHLISNGKAVFKVENDVFEVADGEMIAIPKGMFHSWQAGGPDTLHASFQIDIPIDIVGVIKADSSVIKGMFNEIKKCRDSKNHAVIAAYIALLCNYLPDAEFEAASEVTDAGLLIEEFFSMAYNKGVSLRDLADTLHLSERQTERLIKEYTGSTFKTILSESRIKVAVYLIETTDMSLSSVAEYVGYSSYAGFWKAMKKYSSKFEGEFEERN